MKFKRFGSVVGRIAVARRRHPLKKVIFTDGLKISTPKLPCLKAGFLSNNGDYGSAPKDIVRSGSLSWRMIQFHGFADPV